MRLETWGRTGVQMRSFEQHASWQDKGLVSMDIWRPSALRA